MPAKNSENIDDKLDAYFKKRERFNRAQHSVLAVLVLIMAVMSIFFVIFGFINPDPQNCFYYPGLSTPSRDQDTI